MQHCERLTIGMALVASLTLASCGGGDGGEFVVGASGTPGSGTAYAYVPPAVDSVRTFATTIVDNSNDTILIGYQRTVSAVTDDLLTEQQTSTTGTGSTVDGTNYSVRTETLSYDGRGREMGFSYIAADGTPVSCVYSPYGGGPVPPLSVGQTWQVSYTETCSDNELVDYVQHGSVLDVESVTVPAGTFTVLNLQSTVTWTDAHGTTHQQATHNYVDATTLRTVKESITYVDGGVLPANGYAVSREVELQSGT